MIEHYFSDNAVYCFLNYQLLLIKKDNDELTIVSLVIALIEISLCDNELFSFFVW